MAAPTPDDTGPKPIPTGGDLEIKDAPLIFSGVWEDLEERIGRAKLRFPREFIWLGGAPGAGKGTNTPLHPTDPRHHRPGHRRRIGRRQPFQLGHDSPQPLTPSHPVLLDLAVERAQPDPESLRGLPLVGRLP